jgi:glycosidase
MDFMVTGPKTGLALTLIMEQLKTLHELVKEAHARGIRIVLDAVINHTGPVTEKDPCLARRMGEDR